MILSYIQKYLTVGLSAVIVGLGIYVIIQKGEIAVLKSNNNANAIQIESNNKEISFYKLWIERDKVDADKREAEFQKAMASKPAFRTKIEYVPTGDNCKDYQSIIDIARNRHDK